MKINNALEMLKINYYGRFKRDYEYIKDDLDTLITNRTLLKIIKLIYKIIIEDFKIGFFHELVYYVHSRYLEFLVLRKRILEFKTTFDNFKDFFIKFGDNYPELVVALMYDPYDTELNNNPIPCTYEEFIKMNKQGREKTILNMRDTEMHFEQLYKIAMLKFRVENNQIKTMHNCGKPIGINIID